MVIIKWSDTKRGKTHLSAAISSALADGIASCQTVSDKVLLLPSGGSAIIDRDNTRVSHAE